MANPFRAALDPIFFSFHAYIDAIFERRLQLRGLNEVTSENVFLRASQPDSVADPKGYKEGVGGPTMGQAGVYLDSKKLGYGYEIKGKDAWITEEQLDELLSGANGRPPVFGKDPMSVFSRLLMGGRQAAKPEPQFFRTEVIRIPTTVQGGPSRAVFVRGRDAPNVSYQMDVYLYPKAAKFEVSDEGFRQRYLQISRVHWANWAHQGHQVDVRHDFSLTDRLAQMRAAGMGGEEWHFTVAVTALPELGTFGKLKIELQ